MHFFIRPALDRFNKLTVFKIVLVVFLSHYFEDLTSSCAVAFETFDFIDLVNNSLPASRNLLRRLSLHFFIKQRVNWQVRSIVFCVFHLFYSECSLIMH